MLPQSTKLTRLWLALRAPFMVKGVAQELDVPVCQLEGWEGDDILGTLPAAVRRGLHARCCSSRATAICISSHENVKIVSTRKGVSTSQL